MTPKRTNISMYLKVTNFLMGSFLHTQSLPYTLDSQSLKSVNGQKKRPNVGQSNLHPYHHPYKQGWHEQKKINV